MKATTALRWILAAAVTAAIASGPAAAQRAKRAGPVFEDGQAQVVEAFKDRDRWITHDLWVETDFDSDGDGKRDRMHVDVTRPWQTDKEGLKVPVMYSTSPYFSGTAGGGRSYFWDPEQELGVTPPKRRSAPPVKANISRPLMSRGLIRQWVPRGFAVVHSASPGTGLSQGCPTVGGPNEALAPKAVIDWLNGRAKGFTEVDGDEEVKAYWSTGKVGMTGTSYNGTLPLAAATTGVDGLEAIIPDAPNTSYYHYYRSHGLIRHPGGWMGEDIDVLYDFINSGDPERREWCNCNVRDEEMAEGHDRVTGDYNEFWAGRDYTNQLEDWKCAVMFSHGFNDWNVMPDHSVRIGQKLEELGKAHVQYHFHQGGHGGPPPSELMNRWFTHFLYGVENGIEKGPRSWIVREGAKRRDVTSYPRYPHPESEPVVLYPREGGGKVGDLSLAHQRGQGLEMLVDDVSVKGAELAAAEKSKHRLLYTTAKLKREVHLSGTARLTIRLASSKPAANLSVWIVSLPWTEGRRRSINDNIITRGWADPQNHASLTESEPLVPGEFYELTFTLQPDDQIIPEGQRIGLMIFSSDRDFTLWPPAGTELTVDLDATSLELPVVGGAKAVKKAVGRRGY